MHQFYGSSEKLFDRIVHGGYCIGCGACAAVSSSPIRMKVNEFGCIQPVIKEALGSSDIPLEFNQICPFSSESPSEDDIARELFADKVTHYDNRIGYYLGIYAGFAKEGEYRKRGSSGGMVTWCVTRLLQSGRIDGVIHVHSRKTTGDDQRLFHYQISTTLEQICANTKSQYYPIEMSEVVQAIRNKSGKYVFIGLPCFVKAMRNLIRTDRTVADRVTYCISLVCGHLKSMRWTDLLGWQAGIDLGTISKVGFREKLQGRPSNAYYFRLVGKKLDQELTKDIEVWPLLGGNWGQCFFMYEACNYCDDVFGETADISIGDAWLPQYSGTNEGTNILIPRNPELLKLLRTGKDEKLVYLDELSVDQAADSQSGGLRQRREGLAYRLWLKQQVGEWYPKKRVEPKHSHIGIKRRYLYRLRMKIARLSHKEFLVASKTSDMQGFVNKLTPFRRRYDILYRSYYKAIINRGRKLFSLMRKNLIGGSP